VLAQRAVADSPRWTRAVGIIPATPYSVVVYAALPGTRRVLARQGREGEKVARLRIRGFQDRRIRSLLNLNLDLSLPQALRPCWMTLLGIW